MQNSGIYIIKNIITQDMYVGSSCNLNKRKNAHLNSLLKNKHHSIVLQRAFNKYGMSNFIFEVIFNCNKNDCIEFENIFIQLLTPKYNIAKNAIAPMIGRKHSQETINKFKNKIVASGEKHHLFGKSISNETKEKMSIAHKGSKRTNITKERMSITARRINSISRIDRTKQYRKIIDNDGIIYESMTEAAKLNDISPSTVCDIIKGRHIKTRKGKSFKYYE